jgi:CDP-diacylglycerol--glycerol-3-phosphate 3-phosphatidyltransferase
MHYIPIALIWSRLFIGLLMIVLSAMHVNDYQLIAVTLLITGLLTDIFDGIIARRLNVSTQRLRRLDSGIDQVFFISVAIATYMQCPEFFRANASRLIILLGLEGLAYLISFLKFKKEIATHSIGAKVWTLLIVATLIQIMLQCHATLLFHFCFWVGIITRLEIIAIILVLKQWASDVPTVYHAGKLRQGKKIKRHPLFNG